ncbi:MAG: type IV pilin protein [Amphritea sp.]
MMTTNARGFTLIELMIAVAIVGILAAIAYPSYLEHINTTWRSTAKACLVEMSQTMERRFAANMAYGELDSDGDGTDDLFQSGCSIEGGMANRYGFGFSAAVSSGAYTLQATPKGGPLGDGCKTLSLDHIGIKGVSSDATQSVSQCW